MTSSRTDSAAWWRAAVMYQVYIRSFADGNGDGIGDLAGLRAASRTSGELGVDAIWINPWYPSPMADAGYDVADYRDIDPPFGTLGEAEALIAEAHALGSGCCSTSCPNHISYEHPWFRAALRGGPGSPSGTGSSSGPAGADGAQPPNDWESAFGGPAWTRIRSPTEAGEWYLHLFDPGQPDLELGNPEVRAEFEVVLRFWFDRGVDGFRIDVAHGLAKHDGLPDLGERPPGPRRPAGRTTRSGTRTRSTRSIGIGVRSPTRTAIRACSSPRRGCRPGAARPLPAPRRAAHRLPLRFPAVAVAAQTLRAHRRGARALGAVGADRDVGAVEPRRRPRRQPARRAQPDDRSRRRSSWTRRSGPTSSWARAAPGPPPC